MNIFLRSEKTNPNFSSAGMHKNMNKRRSTLMKKREEFLNKNQITMHLGQKEKKF